MPKYLVRRRGTPRVYESPRRILGQLNQDRRRALLTAEHYNEPTIVEIPDDCRVLTIEELKHEISAE